MYKRLTVICALLATLGGCSGKTDQDLCAEGKRAFDKGNVGGAIVLLKSALEKNQNNPDARHYLALAYKAAGKLEQAEKEFLKLERQNPAISDVKLDLAHLYNQMQKPEEAIRKAGEYLAARPGSADALETLGIAHALRNMAADAENDFLAALKAEPGRISAKLELATLYRNQDKPDRARALLNEVLATDPANSRALFLLAAQELAEGNRKQALAIYAKISGLHKSNVEAPYRAAAILLDQGDIANATKAANDLVERFPKRAEGYRLRGIIDLRQGKYSEAISSLQNSQKIQPTIAGLYFLGLSLYSKGELENALSQFRLILDKTPSFHQARLLSGIILLRQNRTDDAIAEIGKVVGEDAGNATARNLLGSAYMAKGMYEEGMREFDRATKLEPGLVEAYLKKGMFYLSRGDDRHMESELRTAVKVAPEVLSTRLILSTYYLRKNNTTKALSVLNEGINGKKSDAALYCGMAKVMFAVGKNAQALNYLEQAKKSDPGSTAPYFIGASFQARAGDYDKAINEYSALLAKDPANVGAMLRAAALLELSGRDSLAMNLYNKAKETGNAQAYLALAKRYVRSNDPPKALTILDEALKQNPRGTEFLEMKIRLLAKGRRYKDAIRVCGDLEAVDAERGTRLKVEALLAMDKKQEALQASRREVSQRPNSPVGHMLLAQVYRAMNDQGHAVEELRAATKADGNNPLPALMLAEAHAASGDAARAIAVCEEILRKYPESAPAHFAMGTYLQVAGQPRKAIGKYLTTLSLSENNVPALNNLALLYADGNGSADTAAMLARTALALDPGNPAVMDTLGYACLKCGKIQEARRSLEAAAARLPGNPTVNYHLALAYKESGEKTKAVALLRQALSQGNFSEARQAQSLLTELN